MARFPSFLNNTHAAYAWAKKHVDFSDEIVGGGSGWNDQKELDSAIDGRADWYVSVARKIYRQGNATLYRRITIPSNKPWRKTVAIQCLGSDWAWSRDAAEAHWGHDGARWREILMVCVAPSSAINWRGGFESFMTLPFEEEIRLDPHARVALIEVDDEKLDPPIIGNTGDVAKGWRKGCDEVKPRAKRPSRRI